MTQRNSMMFFLALLLNFAPSAMAQVKPVPLINQPLVPDAVAPGGTSFTLTVRGTGFVSTSVVNWNGSARATTFVSSSQLAARITAADIAQAGTATVTVTSPAPGGGTSNPGYLPIAATIPRIGFQQAQFPPIGHEGLAVGDFNGDGILDVVAADEINKDVTVALGNGNGSFRIGSVIPAASKPLRIAAADFNGDGNLDLAVGEDYNVSIYLGDGTGHFTAASVITIGETPGSIVPGDFNEDGILDLAVSDYLNDVVKIFLGDGKGNFSLVTSLPLERPLETVIGDFNDDGHLDLAVYDANEDKVAVFLGDGNGGFSAGTTLNLYAAALFTADFNGDGELDLAVATSHSVLIYLGDGAGNFQQTFSVGSGQPEALALGDFDADGMPDLAVGVNYGQEGYIEIFRGDGTGSFPKKALHRSTNGILNLFAGDFNSDGRTDLMANAYAEPTLLLQGPPGELSPSHLDFGEELVNNSSAPQPVTITNNGYAPIRITGVEITGGRFKNPDQFSVTNNCPSILAVGASCTAQVTFSPTEAISLKAGMIVTGDGGFNPFYVALTGTGVALVASPPSLDFGSVMVGQSSPPMSTVVTNTGHQTVGPPFNIRIKGAAAGDFREQDNCPSSLSAGASCTITVIFTPSQTGQRMANVNVEYSGGYGEPLKIPLSGTGT